MRNRITELLGLKFPIIQAPMAGVSTPAMAAAVANAGGLGMVAVGAMNAQEGERTIAAAMAATNAPIGVNVFVYDRPRRDAALEAAWLHALRPLFARFGTEPPKALTELYRSFNDDDDMLAMLVARRPAAVSLHFGVPAPGRVRALKGCGAVLFATATSVAEAKELEAAGVDVVVAQGIEAGGHWGGFRPTTSQGGMTTMALVPRVVAALGIPVVAAGGIADGRGIAAVLTLGAEGAQLGTAFISCTESLASDAYRRALSGAEVVTAVTSAVSGRPARGVMNPLIAALETVSARVPDYPVAYDAAKALVAAASRAGSSEFSVMWAGQGAGNNRRLSAGSLVELLAIEAEAALTEGRLS